MPTSTAPQSFPSLYISVWVNRDPATAYDFLHQPENFPRWATGLASGLRRATDVAVDRNEWIAAGPEGESRVRFSTRDDFWVGDHVGGLPDGPQIAIPLRVTGHGDCSNVQCAARCRLEQADDGAVGADRHYRLASRLGGLAAEPDRKTMRDAV